MGKESEAMQGYLDKKEHFADFFNGCYFQGKQVVQPEALQEGSEVYHQAYQKKEYQSFAGEDQDEKVTKKKNPAPRTRDVKKRLKSGRVLRVLAIEHQSRVNYIMPLRHMYYDALEYMKQMNEISSENKRQHRLKTDEEFLSGLTESDRLAPAFTACLYLGTKPWTGPKNLKEMMDFGEDEEGWQELFADYNMNLICVNEITDFSVFHTELRLLFMLLAYREDEEKMEKEIMSNPEFAKLDRETAYVASVLLGNELLMEMCEEEEGDTVDMCGALKTWGERKTAEGRAEGRDILNCLNHKLVQDGRMEDLIKALSDVPYQNQLLQEYGLV